MIAVLPSMIHPKTAVLGRAGGGKSGCLNMVGYGSYLQVGNGAKLKIGDSFINREVKIICNKSITIGDDCIIAMGTVIRDNDGGNHQIFAP